MVFGGVWNVRQTPLRQFVLKDQACRCRKGMALNSSDFLPRWTQDSRGIIHFQLRLLDLPEHLIRVTNAMDCGTWRFNAAFTRALQ